MSIHKKIKRFRESKNYTQEFVASKLGVSQNSYSRIEQGSTKIGVDRLIKLTEILDVNINDLLDADQTFNITNNQTVNGNVANNNSIEELKELFEKLLIEKDLRITQFEQVIIMKDELLDNLRGKIIDLEKKIKNN